jgi:hypothetical protein
MEEQAFLTTAEKLSALDSARKTLDTQTYNKEIIRAAKLKAEALSSNYYYTLAGNLGINERDLKKIIIAGIEKAIEEANAKTKAAEEVIEYLK